MNTKRIEDNNEIIQECIEKVYRLANSGDSINPDDYYTKEQVNAIADAKLNANGWIDNENEDGWISTSGMVIASDFISLGAENKTDPDQGVVIANNSLKLQDVDGCQAFIGYNSKLTSDTGQPVLTVYDTNTSTEAVYGPSKIVYSTPNDDWSDYNDYSLNFPNKSGTLATTDEVQTIQDSVDNKLNANGWTDTTNGWTFGDEYDETGNPITEEYASINTEGVAFGNRNWAKDTHVNLDGVVVSYENKSTNTTCNSLEIIDGEINRHTKVSGEGFLIGSSYGYLDTDTIYGKDGITYEHLNEDESDKITNHLSFPEKSGTIATTDEVATKLDANGWENNTDKDGWIYNSENNHASISADSINLSNDSDHNVTIDGKNTNIALETAYTKVNVTLNGLSIEEVEEVGSTKTTYGKDSITVSSFEYEGEEELVEYSATYTFGLRDNDGGLMGGEVATTNYVESKINGIDLSGKLNANGWEDYNDDSETGWHNGNSHLTNNELALGQVYDADIVTLNPTHGLTFARETYSEAGDYSYVETSINDTKITTKIDNEVTRDLSFPKTSGTLATTDNVNAVLESANQSLATKLNANDWVDNDDGNGWMSSKGMNISNEFIRIPPEEDPYSGLTLDYSGITLYDIDGCYATLSNQDKVNNGTGQPALLIYDTNSNLETIYGPSQIVRSMPNDDWTDTIDYTLNFPAKSGTLATTNDINNELTKYITKEVAFDSFATPKDIEKLNSDIETSLEDIYMLINDINNTLNNIGIAEEGSY